MNKTAVGFAALVSMVGLATVFSVASADTSFGIQREVTLKSNAQVYSQSICLNDIVEESWITNRCLAERNACCKWTLGGSRSKSLKKAEVEKLISSVLLSGITLALKGSPEVVVEQTHRELSAKEIESKILANLSARFKDQEITPKLSSVRIIGNIYVPLLEESDWEVLLPENIVEQLSTKVVSTKDNAKNLGWVQASVRLESEVYVAKKTVRPTEPIKLEDFELRKANILSGSPNKAIFKSQQFPEAVLARMTISMGQPLTTNAIERVPLVRLGDAVTLILRSDSLKISTKGVVQSSAAVGDMVTVQLPHYNRTFRGRLVEGRFVEVWL